MLRRQQPVDGLQRLLQGSLILFDHLTSRPAHPLPFRIIREEGHNLLCEILRLENPTATSRLDQEVCNLRTVIGVGTEQHRLRPLSRLQQIVSTNRNECASDERHHSFPVDRSQFAPRVEQHHTGAGRPQRAGLPDGTASLHGEPARPNHRLDRVRPFSMSRSQQQDRRGTLCHERSIAFHESLFFAGMGTACHKQLFRLLKPKMSPCRPTLRDGWYRLVELNVPRSPDS